MYTATLTTINEMHKGILIIWSYKFNMLMQLLSLAFIFIGISYFMGGGELQPEQLSSALLGYMVWFYAASAVSNMSWDLREETQVGTLEQMYMSPVRPALLLLGRTIANLLTTTVMVVLMGGILVLALGIPLQLRWEGLPIFVITLVGLFGFGFMIGGATLIFKHSESLGNLFQNALLFLNGALLPVDRLPGWLETFALTMPTTQGIIVLRNVMIDGQSLGAVWADGSLIWLIAHSLVYFILGWTVFAYCERIAKQRALLGQY